MPQPKTEKPEKTPTTYFVVSISYRRVEAASPREADERDAREHPREGDVGISASGAVSVTG